MVKFLSCLGQKICYIIVVWVILVYLLYFFLTYNHAYFSGKDTIKSYADGRYQILVFSVPEDESFAMNKKSLYDMKENKCIVADILHYKEMDDILYLINKNTYTILKYQEEKYKQSSSLTDFTLEEQQIFQEVKYSPS